MRLAPSASDPERRRCLAVSLPNAQLRGADTIAAARSSTARSSGDLGARLRRRLGLRLRSSYALRASAFASKLRWTSLRKRPRRDLNPCRRRERPVSLARLDDGDVCRLALPSTLLATVIAAANQATALRRHGRGKSPSACRQRRGRRTPARRPCRSATSPRRGRGARSRCRPHRPRPASRSPRGARCR